MCKKHLSFKFICSIWAQNVQGGTGWYRGKDPCFSNLDCLCFIFAQNVQGGSEIVGQLGHGNTSAYKAPKKVEELEDVIQVSCGEDFTFCVSGQLTCS